MTPAEMPAIPPADAPRLSDAELIARAASALNPQQRDGEWIADVGAAVESADGRVFTGACLGGYLSVCAEMGALSQMVSVTGPTISRIVAVWRNPEDRSLHVLPPCGRCREFLRTISQANLEATVILGPGHTATLRELLPYPGWHAEAL
ncbi:cytidine deaminase family protein [Brachybacterium sp. DNPG3]